MSVIKTIKYILLGLIVGATLLACNQTRDENTLKVGTIAGPETELMQVAKEVVKEEGINLEIIVFSDYVMPNTALNDGSIDANMFQHQPYLEQTVKDRGYKLISIGKTFIYPMGGYSKRFKTVNELPQGAVVAIPNDPSNGARALLLLQKYRLISLNPDKTVSATVKDISDNPQKLQFKELDAAQLPRALEDVDLAIINTNYAIPAGLTPSKDALIKEDANSLYANIVAVREADKTSPRLNQLVEALHSAKVQEKAASLFQNQAIAAWK